MGGNVKFEALADEYSRLWGSMVVRSSFKGALDISAKKIMEGKPRYAHVSELTGVPWFVIGIIHQMESGCRWGCHLHNGDPLSARTRQIPAKRPAKGTAPFKWEESACDALMMKNMQSIKDWSIERISYELERYNGWGYRNYHKAVLTPYLWSGTTHYARGKYVADGKWSETAVSGQTGALPLLKTLMSLDASITLGAPPVEVKPEPQETVPESFKKASEWQWPAWVTTTLKLGGGAAAGDAATGGTVTQHFLPSIPQAPDVSSVAGWQNAAETLSNFAHSPVLYWALGGIILYTVICHLVPRFAERKSA